MRIEATEKYDMRLEIRAFSPHMGRFTTERTSFVREERQLYPYGSEAGL